MARFNINGLIPDTDYVYQVRAVTGDEHSKWSRKFNIHTLDDLTGMDAPGNVTWVASGETFHGEWDSVTSGKAGKRNKVDHYEVQLGANSITKTVTIAASTMNRLSYNLSFEKNRAFFGTPQETVTFRVRAVNSIGVTGDWSATLSAGNVAPDTPTNFVATGTLDSIALSWTRSTAIDVLTYDVHVGTTAGFVASTANRIFSANADSFVYTTSTYTTQYFKLFAVDKYGLKSAPATASAAPISPFVVDTTAPDVPAITSATLQRAGTEASALLAWSFNGVATQNTDIQAFSVRWRKVGDTYWSQEFYDKALRNSVIRLPQAYADYEFQIASIDFVANYSAYSTPAATISGSVPGPPPQVTGVTATPGLDSIQLSWTPSTAGDVVNGGYYQVQIATNSGFTTGLLSYSTGNSSITVNGLSPTTQYYYRVSAIDTTAQQGSWSTTASTSTTSFPTVALSDGSAPASSPTPTVVGGIGYLFVAWSPLVNNDLVTYEIHISTTSNFTTSGSTKVAEITGTVATLKKDAAGADLTYGTTYYVKIIAKDRDGAAAASTQGSGNPVKAQSYDIQSMSIAQITAGSILGQTFVLDTGGIIQSANYDGTHGFSLTANALIIREGTVNAGVLESGSTITANLSVTGNMTISSSGTIKSTNYVPSTSGFSLSSAGLDVRSGTISFGTLVGGTMSATGLSIGAGGIITVDSTGAIQSNNYSPASTGWRLSATGLELNNGTVKATAISGDTLIGRTVTVSGSVSSNNWNGSTVGWNLDSTGFTMNNGTITGTNIKTNSLVSATNDTLTGLPYFSINAGGFAQFSGAKILGNTILGSSSSTTHYIQSYNYSPGTTGWKIDATGAMEMNTGTFRGTISGASITSTTSIIGVSITGATFTTTAQSGSNVLVQLSTGQLTLKTAAGTEFGNIGPVTGKGIYLDGGAGANSAYLGVMNDGSIDILNYGGKYTSISALKITNTMLMGPGTSINSSSTIDLSVSNGAFSFASSANIAGRIDGGASSSAIVFDGARVVIGVNGYTSAAPSSTNTKNLFALSVNGYGAYVNASDEREKNSIENVSPEFAIKKVKEIEISRFRHNVVDPERDQYGIIAQQVLGVLPSAIKSQEDGHYMASYQDIWAIGFAATKELVRQVEDLRRELNEVRRALDS